MTRMSGRAEKNPLLAAGVVLGAAWALKKIL
jgi:hypothetical protein